MDKVEIQREITRLERKLEQLKEEKRKAKNDTDKINGIFNKASSARRKVESEFDSMLRDTRKRSSVITSEKFRNRYNSKMQSIFKGAKANQALDNFNKIIGKARQAAVNTDDSIREIVRKINNTTRRIEELKQELNQGDK